MKAPKYKNMNVRKTFEQGKRLNRLQKNSFKTSWAIYLGKKQPVEMYHLTSSKRLPLFFRTLCVDQRSFSEKCIP